MSAPLFAQFLTEECTPHVRTLICDAIAKSRRGEGPTRQQFEFNRFNLTLDFEDARVTLEDELDVTSSGTATMPLNQLAAELQC